MPVKVQRNYKDVEKRKRARERTRVVGGLKERRKKSK
jgi:hypothetical protein